jgi:serine/threonine protein kinase
VTVQICTQCGGNHAPGACPEVSRSADDSLAPAPVPGVISPMPIAWLAGAMVGEYEVSGLLGQGGMGVVYSGVHPLLGRKVAIKVLHRQAALVGEAAARFLQEARAASKLRHQNIVDVFAFGQMADGHYYQVMEFLEGESLRSVLHARGALTRGQARTVIVGVLSGLGVAHRRGIVHRDVKPDNIFLCAPIETLTASDVKVLDFGLAKNEFANESSIKTRTGMTLGTPAYMSPEQCRSAPGVDGRADLYAAGIVLYEMLVGQAPFQSDSAFDLMTMQINLPPPRVSTVIGHAEPLEGVIAQAMEKRPAARFDTAEDMLAAIDAVLPARGSGGGVVGSAEREPIVVRSPSATEVANRPTLVGDSGGAKRPSGAGGVVSVATQPSVSSVRSLETKRVSRLRPAMRGVIALGVVGAAVAAFVMIPGFRERAPAPAVVAAPVQLTPAQPPPRQPSPPQQQPVAPAAVAVEPASKSDSIKPWNRKRASTRVPVRYKTAQGDLDMPLNPYERRPR